MVGRTENMTFSSKKDPRLPELLTTTETAELLRLKERKIYDLVASDEIPHVRITGKILFPRVLIDQWIARHTSGNIGGDEPHPPPICVGSHDPLLSWALRESDCGIASLCDGSLDGLDRMAKQEAMLAGIHLRGTDGSNSNTDSIAKHLPGQPVVAIEWAWRTQGLILPAGNPLNINSIADLKERKIAPRQRSSGTFVLLLELIKNAGLSKSSLTFVDPPSRNESEVALAVMDGRADAGLGLELAARQHKLDFVPITRERFDLVIWRRAFFEKPFQKLVHFCRSDRFLSHARDLAGYEIDQLGRVHFNAQ